MSRRSPSIFHLSVPPSPPHFLSIPVLLKLFAVKELLPFCQAYSAKCGCVWASERVSVCNQGQTTGMSQEKLHRAVPDKVTKCFFDHHIYLPRSQMLPSRSFKPLGVCVCVSSSTPQASNAYTQPRLTSPPASRFPAVLLWHRQKENHSNNAKSQQHLCLRITTLKQKQQHPVTWWLRYPSILTACPVKGHEGAWNLSQMTLGDSQGTPCQSITGPKRVKYIHSINLARMSLGLWGEVGVDREKPHRHR